MRGLAWTAITAVALLMAALALALTGYWSDDLPLIALSTVIMLAALTTATLSLRE